MTTDSPVVVLFNSDGYELNVKPSTAIPSGTTAILTAGSDGIDSHFLAVDSSGRTIVVGAGIAGSSAGGLITIQGDPAGIPIPISSVSTSTIGSTTPSSATLSGGAVTTAAPTYTTGQMSPLSLTTTGLLRIDGSAVTQPVSGTVSTTQSGTWTIQPGNTANTTPWLMTISQDGNNAIVSADGYLKVDSSSFIQQISAPISFTGNPNNISSSISAVTLFSANASRKGATIYNDSDSILYIQFDVTVSSTNFIVLIDTNEYYEVPFGYTGIITGVWDTAVGSARVVEIV